MSSDGDRPRRVALEELGALLSLFAHDLRNPLAAALANAELLAEAPELDEEAREAVADSRIALLDAQRGLDQLGFVAAFLVGEAAGDGPAGELGAALAEAAARVGIPVEVRCPEKLSVSSARLVGRVVEALLANARDHAPHGSARVDVAATGDRAVIQVADGGRAIAPGRAELCFDLAGQARIKSLPGARYGRCAALFACRVAMESIGGSLSAGGEDGAAFFRLVAPLAARAR